MLITIEGQYKDGKVSLAEAPPGLDRAKVIVTFLPAPDQNPGGSLIQFGMFKGPRSTEPEDFQAAEWRGPTGA